MSKLFETLDIETFSMCNRTCVTCIRNSHPDKDATHSFFRPNHLPMWIIGEAFEQSIKMGFRGDLILSHYNEPLLDYRIVNIVRLAKEYPFKSVWFHTNGDLMTEEMAKALDDVVDEIRVTLYMDDPVRSQRAEWITGLFQHTKIAILIGDHIPTHFSPVFDVEALAKEHCNKSCTEADIRCIINHRGQFLLCCDDVVGNFDLGTFPEKSIEEYWFGEKRVSIARTLSNVGGRLNYNYCSTCPRP